MPEGNTVNFTWRCDCGYEKVSPIAGNLSGHFMAMRKTHPGEVHTPLGAYLGEELAVPWAGSLSATRQRLKEYLSENPGAGEPAGGGEAWRGDSEAQESEKEGSSEPEKEKPESGKRRRQVPTGVRARVREQLFDIEPETLFLYHAIRESYLRRFGGFPYTFPSFISAVLTIFATEHADELDIWDVIAPDLERESVHELVRQALSEGEEKEIVHGHANGRRAAGRPSAA